MFLKIYITSLTGLILVKFGKLIEICRCTALVVINIFIIVINMENRILADLKIHFGNLA